MKKSQKLIYAAVVTICLIAGTVIGSGIRENLFPLPTKIEQKEVPLEGIMVMDDEGELHPYQYIAKWNVYGKLPDDYESTSMTAASVTYRNDTDRIGVECAYLNYWWDNPHLPITNITTTIINIPEYIDKVAVKPNNCTFCLVENAYLYEPLILTNNLSIPAQYTLDATLNPDVSGVSIGFVYIMDDGVQFNITRPMWIKSETYHTIFMTIETDESFKPGVYGVDIAILWSAVGRIQ